jgi:hypothetical protein
MNLFVYDNPALETRLRIIFFVLMALWSLPWKGVALWKAARNSSKGWFVALLLINTLGILEILYIFIFSKKTAKTLNQPQTLS